MSWFLSVPLPILKVSLVLVLAWLALTTMRRCSASARHLVVAVALGATLLVPLLERALPGWETLPRPAEASIQPSGDGVATSTTNRPVRESVPVTEPRPAAARSFDHRETSPTLGVRATVKAVWLGGVVGLLALLTVRLVAMRLTVRRAEPLDDPAWTSLVDDARAQLGIRRAVALRRRGAGEMPAVWGVLRPVILLPAECDSWSAGRRRAVLVHELAHVGRGDVLLLLLAQVAGALHWFNPLVWVLRHRLAIEREHACDDIALRAGLRPSLYADHLLATAATHRHHRKLAPVMAAPSQLEDRIMAILDPRRNHGNTSRRVQAAVLALALTVLIPLASLTWAQHDEDSNLDTPPYVGSLDRELQRLGIAEDDIDGLTRCLRSTTAISRAACARALARTGDPRRIEPLLASVNDSDERVREWVVRGLADVNDPRVVDALLPLFDDTSADVREWCVRELGDLDDPRVFDSVLLRLDDDAGQVREWAVRRLAGSDDDRVQDAFALALYDEKNADVQEWLVRSIEPRRTDGGVDALIAALDSPSDDVREWAVRRLADTGDRRGIRPMMDMLRDASDEVREWAVRGLMDSGDPAAIASLRELRDDPSEDVREWVERALENR